MSTGYRQRINSGKFSELPCDKVANNVPSISTGGIPERWHRIIHLLQQQVIPWRRFRSKMDLWIRAVARSSTYPPSHQFPHTARAFLYINKMTYETAFFCMTGFPQEADPEIFALNNIFWWFRMLPVLKKPLHTQCVQACWPLLWACCYAKSWSSWSSQNLERDLRSWTRQPDLYNLSLYSLMLDFFGILRQLPI